MSFETPSNENSIEKIRQSLSQEVKFNLEKYKEEIKDFSIFTSSKEANGFFETGTLGAVPYNEDYDERYEVVGVSKQSNYFQEGKSGYVLGKPLNWFTFIAPLGRTLHTPDRSGNLIGINLKGEKGERLNEELIESLLKLVQTITPYEKGLIDVDLKNIAKEAIPLLQAFEDMEDVFPSTGRISIKSMISEYNSILNNS